MSETSDRERAERVFEIGGVQEDYMSVVAAEFTAIRTEEREAAAVMVEAWDIFEDEEPNDLTDTQAWLMVERVHRRQAFLAAKLRTGGAG